MRTHGITLALVSTLAAGAHAQNVSISFENLNPDGGTAFTPVFFGLHDGSFDLFSIGSAASAGLERLAELGATDTLTSEFGAAGPSGTTAGGPILGGQSVSLDLNVTDPTSSRFLTFASMVVPTNDLFIGNGNPLAYEIFDAAGNFNGPVTIEIFGSNVYDAGTEVNNADDGAAFLQGIDGAAGETEGSTVSLFINDPTYVDYLDSLLGRTTAPGFDITSVFSASDPIARITITPAPSTAGLLGLGGLVAARRRRA